MILTLNGKDYPLRFSVNALCALEEKTGRSLDALQGSQMSCVRGLLWCGLRETLPHVSLEEAGELIDGHLRAGGTLKSVSDALAAALEDACFFPRPGKSAPPSP